MIDSDSINQNYRMSDNYNWRNNPIVIGKRISLSNSNSKRVKILRCDLCQQLAGEYPSDFIWTGWHEGCICYTTPILMNDQSMAKYTRLIAKGEDTDSNIENIRLEAGVILNYPEGFKDWIISNIRSQESFENAPEWIASNFTNFNELKSIL